MKSRALKAFVCATALAFVNGMLPLPIAVASSVSLQEVNLEVIVKVSQKGFSDRHGKLFGPRNMLKIPKEKMVRITFVFDEKVTDLAYGDTHQIAITGTEGWTKESAKIWMFNQQTSVTFQTGKDGAQYRAYCIIDCIGMEHLNNLLIKVG